MYRDNKQILTHVDHRFMLTHGALGDMITSLPALIHARASVSEMMTMVVYVAPWQVDLVKHLLAPYGAFDIRPMTDVPLAHKERRSLWGDDVSTSMNAATHNTHTRNRVHMVDYAFAFLLDARPESMAQRSYPVLAPIEPRTIAEKYVVFPVGATSDNKLFKASLMAPIIDWVASRGYTPVLVGTKTSHTRAEMGDGEVSEPLVIRDEVDKLPALTDKVLLNLCEKTTLLSLRNILGNAEAVVGVDGGTLHLAGTTNTNIVYAMGTTLPKHRYIARYGDLNHKIKYVVPRDLECAGCQSNWHMTRWDFRFCAYDDNKCMDSFHADDFIEGLKELGL